MEGEGGPWGRSEISSYISTASWHRLILSTQDCLCFTAQLPLPGETCSPPLPSPPPYDPTHCPKLRMKLDLVYFSDSYCSTRYGRDWGVQERNVFYFQFQQYQVLPNTLHCCFPSLRTFQDARKDGSQKDGSWKNQASGKQSTLAPLWPMQDSELANDQG